MEEHQATSSDLASLLASTDIAVLFLDTGFRIRRYTPAVTRAAGPDPLATSGGRWRRWPAGSTIRTWTTTRGRVLERLVPVEREVAGADGRHYLRRVLPYRTTDNRIDGVVVTFVDISAPAGRGRGRERLLAERTAVMEGMAEGIVLADATGAFLLLQPRRTPPPRLCLDGGDEEGQRGGHLDVRPRILPTTGPCRSRSGRSRG